jgi:UDP-N-acetyl-D-mannosaminuronate dehydrogenase
VVLGKLGLPLLVTIANNNQKIIGSDIDQDKINLLKAKKIPLPIWRNKRRFFLIIFS